MKLIEIARGWVNFVVQPDDLKELARTRLSICDECPFKKQMNAVGSFIIASFNDQANTFICGKCGCPLAAKSVSPMSECPLGKWPTLDRSSY